MIVFDDTELERLADQPLPEPDITDFRSAEATLDESIGARSLTESLTPKPLSPKPADRPYVIMTFNKHEVQAVRDVFLAKGGTIVRYESEDGTPYWGLGWSQLQKVRTRRDPGTDPEQSVFRREVILAYGAQGPSAAQSFAGKICRDWNPVAILDVGICYGSYPNGSATPKVEQQQIGDVIVSTFCDDGNNNRVNEKNGLVEIEPRGIPKGASTTWVQRIMSTLTLSASTGSDYSVSYGGLVCSGALVDSMTVRDLLAIRQRGTREEDTVIGGDMETWGIATVCAEDYPSVQWIAIKGIADFADGQLRSRSREEKAGNQRQAARNAASVAWMALDAEEIEVSPKPSDTEEQEFGRPFLPDLAYAESSNLGLGGVERWQAGAFAPNQGTPQATSDDPTMLDKLFKWAESDTAKPLFVLLGEYGTGKTVTCQTFVHNWLRERENDPVRIRRRPLYFDLRKVRGRLSSSPASFDRPSVFDVMASVARLGWEDSTEITPGDLQKHVQAGAIIVFDGLDEALHGATKDVQELFTGELLSIIERLTHRRAGGPPPKVLLSTRSELFKTLQDQQQVVLQPQQRQPFEFEAWELLRLSEEQIYAYFAKTLPERSTAEVRELLAAAPSIHDLCQRPLTLRMVTEQLSRPGVWPDKDKPLSAASLYRSFVTDLLGRDDPRCKLETPHKLFAVEHLAVEMQRTGRPSQSAQELQEWFTKFLKHPDRDGWLEVVPADYDRLNQDLRDSTFLRRDDPVVMPGDEQGRLPGVEDGVFVFAHSSFQEFFVSEHLLHGLQADQPETWDLPKPSPLTFDFLGQSLAEIGARVLTDRMGQWYASQGSTAIRNNLIRYRQTTSPVGYPQAPRLFVPFKASRRDPDADYVEPETLEQLCEFLRHWKPGPRRTVVVWEDIDWRVLGRADMPVLSGGTTPAALLLADRVVDFRAWNDKEADVPWAESTLRHWLNHEFIDTWSSNLRDRVVPVSVVTRDHLIRPGSGGPACQDGLFLLSGEEVVEHILAGNSKAKSDWRKYGYVGQDDRLVVRSDGRERVWWWLRSPGGASSSAALVYPVGDLRGHGRNSVSAGGGVRPAFWLNLESAAT